MWSSGRSISEAGTIITFGIQPDRPEAGYGYIERGHLYPERRAIRTAFHEKPDEATAQAMLDSGTSYGIQVCFWLIAEPFGPC